ncbi:MAG: dihydrolipoamide acetyltransferase family protein, partial [Pseudomonadota bacterium]
VFADEDVPQSEVDDFISTFKAADAGFGVDAGEADEPPAGAPAATAVPAGLSISPKAAELAARLGVDLAQVTGSGRRGRVSLQDVEQAAKAQGLGEDPPADANPYDVVKLSAMRRTIAKRLVEATQQVPHFYLRTTVCVDPLLSRRAALKETGAAPSVNDFLIKACAVALIKTPDVNVHFLADEIRRFRHADVAVAVAVPGGLVTPVIRRADEKSVAQISDEMKDLADRARAEKLEQSEYQGGTFSLSNLGMFGVESFDAVVNPPMGAILAAGAATRRPSADGGHETVMVATMSCDHRAVDGALGGRFLQAFKEALETPESL